MKKKNVSGFGVGTVRMFAHSAISSSEMGVSLPPKGNSNSHGARPVHLFITMIKWIRTLNPAAPSPATQTRDASLDAPRCAGRVAPEQGQGSGPSPPSLSLSLSLSLSHTHTPQMMTCGAGQRPRAAASREDPFAEERTHGGEEDPGTWGLFARLGFRGGRGQCFLWFESKGGRSFVFGNGDRGLFPGTVTGPPLVTTGQAHRE